MKMEKILIVEDNSVNRKILHNILKDEYEIIEADSGEQAIDILKQEEREIAAVLLDIVLPKMSGFSVLKFIRNKAELSEIPVIMQTENTEDTFESNALKMGATDFVTKPYKPEAIRTRLRNVINTRKMLNQITDLESDELTGLMSLNSFYYQGTKWIAENPETEFDIVAEDVAHFSIINESKGMEGGNAILIAMAERIREIQKSVKFLAARVYADRFVLLIKREDGYLERLLKHADALTEEFSKNINVHFRFGIYEITERNANLASVCGRAFSATNLINDYYGNKCVYYDESLHQKLLKEEKINDEMEEALNQKQFEIYFQPKYDIFTNSIAGAEALVRWNHPEDGLISPGEFIPIFEKNGFIVKLDQYIWDWTAALMSAWYQKGEKTVPVSVNISRIDIEDIDVEKCLCGIIEKYHIAPELLHLEITESAYMQDTDKIIDTVTSLKNKGFVIEMDDFGSGYSSLNMLAKLPINILKLDMKFIQSLENSVNAKTIIEYTIGLAKWMNLPVVAEGVETEEQLALLKRLECNYVQGYIYAKPMPVNEFEKLLKSSIEKHKMEKFQDQDLFIYQSNKKHNMLIVEDLQLNRSIIRSYFEESFSIVEAGNGRVALDYLRSGARVDIILLDIYMPEMNGYELLTELKSQKEFKKIPILVISSRINRDEAKKVFNLGADAFLPKPFTAEGIIDKVRILLRAYNVLDDMNIWDLKDTVDNPWMKGLCDDIVIIHKQTGKLCKIEGEKIYDTPNTYEDVLEPRVYEKCMNSMTVLGKRYSAYKEGQYVLDMQLIELGGEQYIVCFKKSIEKADKL